MRLEHWCVVNKSGPYTPPEMAKTALHGNVYGHPRFEDGKEVTTSSISRVENGMVITGSGSIYELGAVDPDYELEYPNAKARILGEINTL